MSDPVERVRRNNDPDVSFREYIDLHINRLEQLMGERDKRYEERHIADVQAVQAALVSADKQVTTAFSASEKAVNKSEEAQQDYNARSNEFRGQLDDQAKTLMPRIEAIGKFDAFDKRLEETKTRYDQEIASLREYRSARQGSSAQQREGRSASEWLISLLIGAIPTALLVGDLLFRKSGP